MPIPSQPGSIPSVTDDPAQNALDGAQAIAVLSQAGPDATAHKPTPILLELLPLAAFFLGYKFADMKTATLAIMAVTAFSIAFQWFVYRRIPVLAMITAGVVAIFGSLTLILHDDTFIKMKPTMIYSIFATLLLTGRAMGKNPLRYTFGQLFALTPHGWHILTLRWAAFFFAMAVANETIWRNAPEAIWVNFKVFGALPLTMVFGLCQMRLLTRETVHNQ